MPNEDRPPWLMYLLSRERTYWTISLRRTWLRLQNISGEKITNCIRCHKSSNSHKKLERNHQKEVLKWTKVVSLRSQPKTLRKINFSSFRRPLPPTRRLSSGKKWILLSRMELSVTFQEAKETRRKFRISIRYQLKTMCIKSDNSFKTLPLLMLCQLLRLERK